MKALRYHEFGAPADVARLEDVAAPVPGRGEALIAVRYVGINPLDWKLMEGRFKIVTRSRPPCGVGGEFAGEVVALGEGVSTLSPDTPVFGFIRPSDSPPRALAEYLAVPAASLTAVPSGLSLAAASTLTVAGLSALQMCRLARVKRGQRVLVNGAAGGVGSFAVQWLRVLGATSVATGSESSRDFIHALQPDAYVDYRRTPVAQWPGPFAALLDCVSALDAAAVRALLPRGGHYVGTLPAFPGVILDMLLNPLRSLQRRVLMLEPDGQDLAALLLQVMSGAVRPRITREFALDDAVAALEVSRSGRARGKLVVRID